MGSRIRWRLHQARVSWWREWFVGREAMVQSRKGTRGVDPGSTSVHQIVSSIFQPAHLVPFKWLAWF